MNDNGILARISGDYIARALQALPQPEGSGPEELSTEIEVPGVGRVLITALRHRRKHGRSSHHFWVAIHAALVEPLK